MSSYRFIKSFLHFINAKIWSKIAFVIIGIASTVWFLVRVIPKPTRATYPCMRAAAPFMSSFVIYLLSIGSASLLLKKFPKGFKSVQVSLTALFFVLALAIPGISTVKNNMSQNNIGSELEEPNKPMGTAKGIIPGRVVWAYNPLATDENCPNTWNKAYYMDAYTNQNEVDKMLHESMLKITNEETVKSAWDAIFKFHNVERGKGAVSYKAGEIIFIKINRTSTYQMKSGFGRGNTNEYPICETSPHVVTSVLRHLVNEVGVAQKDIYIGDPLKNIYADDYAKWHGEFPDVHYLDNSSSSSGREKVVKSTTAIIDYSDRGEVLRTGSWNSALDGQPFYTDNLYTIFEEMEYMINIPTLKGHIRAGVTMFAKNHFGSHTRGDAKHLHGGLVEIGSKDPKRNTYGLYRVQVDLMSHELLGKKNLIFIMDALYSSEHEVNQPDKWQKAPWNNDWTSSIFVSQDPVAIESVGFDFLYYEYDETSKLAAYPHYGAVDDYLHQAADKTNWPAGITYDPENDGKEIASLGVHEHWNNPTEMQYTRNLGTGNGIELYRITPGFFTSNQSLSIKENEPSITVFPNPVIESATLQFNLIENAKVSAELYSIEGRKISNILHSDLMKGEHVIGFNASTLQSGLYFVQLKESNFKGSVTSTFKFEKR